MNLLCSFPCLQFLWVLCNSSGFALGCSRSLHRLDRRSCHLWRCMLQPQVSLLPDTRSTCCWYIAVFPQHRAPSRRFPQDLCSTFGSDHPDTQPLGLLARHWLGSDLSPSQRHRWGLSLGCRCRLCRPKCCWGNLHQIGRWRDRHIPQTGGLQQDTTQDKS